jgi:uncharacterized protein (DUF885 family)
MVAAMILALARRGRERRARFACAISVGLALAACSSAAPAPSVPTVAAPAPTIEAVARRYLALSPSAARSAGLHEYDGQVAPVSAGDIEHRISMLREFAHTVESLKQTSANADERLDCGILAQALAQELFDLTEVESWRTRPMYYSDLFSVDPYIVRDYAPKEQRARALLAHVKNALQQVGNIEKNLRSPLPQPVVVTSIDVFKGYAEYLRGDVQTFLEQSADPATASEAKPLVLQLATAAAELARRLQTVELPKADQSHVLGRARYEHLLLAQEALTTPIEQLEQMAEADLQRNEAAYNQLAARVSKSRPPASELLSEADQVLAASLAFVSSNHIASVPSTPNVSVKETPPFMRWNSAFLNAGGPLDPAELAAYYYITLPDPAWPAKEQAEYVMSRGEIVSTTVHEVFPGHYLQALWQRNAPTFTQKVFGSYSFTEGWAHYVEQMMVDEGFAAELPEARLGQLSDALLRDCRFVVSIGIHVRAMSLDAAQRRFVDDCKQDAASARQQALRGTFDPGYFAYTLGKLQILALRAEAQQQLGTRFTLGRFHDALLGHGAPQVPLIHDQVLATLARE